MIKDNSITIDKLIKLKRRLEQIPKVFIKLDEYMKYSMFDENGNEYGMVEIKQPGNEVLLVMNPLRYDELLKLYPDIYNSFRFVTEDDFVRWTRKQLENSFDLLIENKFSKGAKFL